MIGDLRVIFWQTRCTSIELENNIRMRIGAASVYANVFEELI